MNALMLPQLFDIVPDALLLVDAEGRIIRANGNAERLFGHGNDGLVGLSVEALMPADARERHLQHRLGYMSSPRIRPMGQSDQVLVGQKADGQQFPVEIALSPIETAHGRHYLASVRDISESQRVRQALVRASYDAFIARLGQMALDAGSEQQLVRSLPGMLIDELQADAVALAFPESDGHAIDVRVAGQINGEALRHILSSRWALLEASLPVDRATILDDRQLELLAEAGEGFACGAATLLRDRDHPTGILMVLSTDTRPIQHDILHLIQGVAVLVAAIMQRRRTAEQLAHAQRLDALGQLTGGIAHDFNNLLTIISGSLQLLDDEYAPHQGARDLIAGALHSVARGASLTSKLLAFARRQPLAPQSVKLHQLVHDLGTMLQRILGESFSLTIECHRGLPPAHVDPCQLETALVNVVLNARDALPGNGEILLSVGEQWVRPQEMEELQAGHYIVIRITDRGMGMSASTARRAVEPFFTTKSMGQGSGLGLSMVYGFTRQSRGMLHIDTVHGRGTTVSMYLPVATSLPERVLPPRHRVEGARQTILVVEDDPGVRRIAVSFLKAAGYVTLEACDAAEALAIAKIHPETALVFSDVMLGGAMNGHALASALREQLPGLAVLLTTGHDDAPDATPDLGHCGTLLRKPYRREDLLVAVQQLIA
ncbi:MULTISPECIES: PAS domain S-box protein [unclassified Stenotrophomonas]|uniref:PAS domain S-box protein n=1 Tax=unclassified Stenotrophomonas TaxID=196198 RepID=UPI0012FF220C|nr:MULTISPECIES: PAS domain S-box protein [unclassified Stenotrophomonas]